MSRTPKPGQTVAWNTPQGETTGTVKEVVTETTKVAGHTAKATEAHPQVVVESDKSGKEAVHKPESLHKPK